MKSSVILSLSLDGLAIGIMLVPAKKFRALSGDVQAITRMKRTCFFLLLLSGFLIDQYISHPGP